MNSYNIKGLAGLHNYASIAGFFSMRFVLKSTLPKPTHFFSSQNRTGDNKGHMVFGYILRLNVRK